MISDQVQQSALVNAQVPAQALAQAHISAYANNRGQGSGQGSGRGSGRGSGGSSGGGKRKPIYPYTPWWRPDLWRRDLMSMWRSWTPPSRSIVWKMLGVSALLSVIATRLPIPLILTPISGPALGHWWVPLTAGWVESASYPLMLILILGYVAASKSGALKGQVKRPRYFGYAIGVFAVLTLLASILGGFVYGLVIQGLMLIWFGHPLERQLGSRRLLTLSLVTLTGAYLVGSLSLMMSLGGVPMSGFQPLSRALIIAWGHQLGDAHLAILNIRANQIRWVVYAFAGFEILLYPNPIGFTSLTAALIVDFWMRKRIKWSL